MSTFKQIKDEKNERDKKMKIMTFKNKHSNRLLQNT